MDDPIGLGLKDFSRAARSSGEPPPRAVGAPLPMGGSSHVPLPADPDSQTGSRSAVPPGRALANTAGADSNSGLQRAVNALRMAIPFVQRLLPLLDGHVATAVSNILGPQPQQPQVQVQPVDLSSIEDGLAELHGHHRDLRAQVIEQNGSLKRVEDQLEMVREATDRNTLEQQELLEDLKTVGNKVNVVAFLVLALLAASVLLNLILFLHIRRVLP